MSRLQVEDTEYEQQTGGKGVGKDSGLNGRTDDHQDTHYRTDKTGTFGLAIAQEKQTYRDPHDTN